MIIDKHPNRDAIVTAILSGKTQREVAEMAGISHTAVGNYVRKILRPAMVSSQKAIAIARKSPESKEAISQVKESLQVARTAGNSAALSPVLARIARRQEVQAELMEAARLEKDYRGYGTIDSCEHKDIELSCRLLGLLDSQPSTVAIQNNSVFMLPSILPGPDSDSDIIDVLPE